MTPGQSSSVSLGDRADRKQWIDVTVPIRDQMVHYPGDPGVELRVTKHLDRGDPATVSHLSLGVHTGTHVDAPVHFIGGAAGVDLTSIESMNGPARIIEIPDKENCTAQDLAPFDISAGERVLLRTSNSTRCRNVDTFVEDYTHLDISAAKFLTERRIRMIGIKGKTVAANRKITDSSVT
jgi:arylformamidase